MSIKRFNINSKFQLITISGRRYVTSCREILSWLNSKSYFAFFVVLSLALIFLVPHNKNYELELPERFIFWPLLYASYTFTWMGTMAFGAKYASVSSKRYYYTPIGMVLATVICSIEGQYISAFMHNSEPNFSAYTLVEIGINILWISVFEAIFFAMNGLRLDKKSSSKHDWEMFEDDEF